MDLVTRLATATAALVLAVGLAACGDDEESADSQPAGGGQAPGATFPVTVEHEYGTTEIPSEPERVVTVGYTDQDITLALGVVPVGVGDFLGGYDWRNRPWAQEALGGAKPAVVGAQQINFEAVEQTMLVGQALGREDQAADVVADVKAKFESVRSEHPEFEGQTAILAYGGTEGYGAYASPDTRSRFFADLGFKTPARVDQLAGDAFFVAFSQEQFRLMDQDLVVMYGPEDEIVGNPVVGRLDAVNEDRVVYLDLTDQFAGALGFSSALSLPYLLDEKVDALAAAVDGDAATQVEQPQ